MQKTLKSLLEFKLNMRKVDRYRGRHRTVCHIGRETKIGVLVTELVATTSESIVKYMYEHFDLIPENLFTALQSMMVIVYLTITIEVFDQKVKIIHRNTGPKTVKIEQLADVFKYLEDHFGGNRTKQSDVSGKASAS